MSQIQAKNKIPEITKSKDNLRRQECRKQIYVNFDFQAVTFRSIWKSKNKHCTAYPVRPMLFFFECFLCSITHFLGNVVWANLFNSMRKCFWEKQARSKFGVNLMILWSNNTDFAILPRFGPSQQLLWAWWDLLNGRGRGIYLRKPWVPAWPRPVLFPTHSLRTTCNGSSSLFSARSHP